MKKRTLHIRLLLYYGGLITALLVIIFYFFYFYIAGSLKQQSSKSLSMIASTVSARLDDTIKQLSTNSTKILYSSKLKSLFYSDELYKQNIDSLSAQRTFKEIFYEIMGPQLSVSQVNIFHEDGHYISVGNYNAFATADEPLKKYSWFSKALEQDRPFFLSAPHLNNWSYYQRPVISLYRSFSPQFGQKNNAVIEMQLDYVSLETILDSMNISQTLYVIDQDGNLFYTSDQIKEPNTPSQILNYWKKVRTLTGTGTILSTGQHQQDKNIISYTNSEYTGLSVLVIENEYSLFTPVRIFRNNLILLGIVALLVTLLISFIIAKKVTLPIRRLCTSIRKLNLNTLYEPQEEELSRGWDELELLNNSFREMKTRLEYSLEEAISSKSHALQAKLLALQSQMNPHFLYNTLTTISIMAENSGCKDITDTCNSLSSMLRYISDDEPGLVTIREEITHTRDFLNLISIRYGCNLHYDIKIPKEMLSIPLPKMVIEPLVENCVKYAMNGLPPWYLTILGQHTQNTWTISVQDTGSGFEPEKLKELITTFSRLNPQKEIPNLKLNGMGLINIFIRLKLIYGEHAIFSIENREEGGACVIIGGTVSSTKEAQYEDTQSNGC